MCSTPPTMSPSLIEGLSMRMVKPDELEAVARFWTADMGIPVDVKLFKRWYLIDPEAFRVVVDNSNRIIASATVVKQSDELFVVGYLSVSREWKGKGLSGMMLRNMVQRCPTANYVLTANTSKLAMFQKRGFKPDDSGNAYAYLGRFVNQLEKRPLKCADTVLVKVSIGDGSVAALAEYDKLVNGFARNVNVLVLDSTESTVIMVKRNEKVVGYGKIQPYINGGAWLGPIYADDTEVARCLIDALLRSYAGKKCTVLFCVISEKGQPFATTLGLKFIDKLTRCILKPGTALDLPPMKLEKVFVFDDPSCAFL